MEIEKAITVKVQKQRLIRFGHTKRTDETRWARKVLEWVLQEKRERARPKWSWRDDMKKQWKERTALKKSVIEGESGDWGRRNGDSCEIIRKYIYIIIACGIIVIVYETNGSVEIYFMSVMFMFCL
jgi:hypothetical protein